MTDLIYFYDGSFDGFLCCIFDSYAHHEVPTAICSSENAVPTLFSVRTVTTEPTHAKRVFRKVAQLSPSAADLLRRGFFTCMPEREMALYRLVVKLLRDGSKFLQNLSDGTLYPVLQAVKHLNGEVYLLKGFVRFSEFSGVLGAEIAPKNRVLPFLRSHFCARFQNEKFFIYDRTHREVLFYAAGQAVITPLAHFEMAQPDETEAGFRILWKRFYDTIAIKERTNHKCRMTNMPKRYWGTMTEFQGEDFFSACSSPEVAAARAVPAGRSAPAIPLECAQSDPASSL
jgi:probable DNA metabolism protein